MWYKQTQEKILNIAHYCCCCSVAQSWSTLCDPMDCSTPGFLVHHHLPEFAKLMSIELVMLSNHLIFCQPLLLLPSIFHSISSFPVSWLFTSGGQSIGASALVLPMKIQDWFPLGLTGLILLSKGLSRVFSSTEVLKHQSLALSFLYGPTLTSVHDFWKNHSIDYTDLCQNSDVLWISSINLEKHKVSVEKDYLWTDFLFIGREPKGNQRVHKGNRHEIKYEWHIYRVQK